MDSLKELRPKPMKQEDPDQPLVDNAWVLVGLSGLLPKACQLHLEKGCGIGIFRFLETEKKVNSAKANCELYHAVKDSYFWNTICKSESAFLNYYDPVLHFCVCVQVLNGDDTFVESVRVYQQSPVVMVYESFVF